MKIYITLLILLFSLKINAQVTNKDELREKATFMGYKYYFNNEKIKKQKAIQILLQNKSSEVKRFWLPVLPTVMLIREL